MNIKGTSPHIIRVGILNIVPLITLRELEKNRRRWENNWDLEEVGCNGLRGTYLAQDRGYL